MPYKKPQTAPQVKTSFTGLLRSYPDPDPEEKLDNKSVPDALADAGVDVIVSFRDGTYPSAALFITFFLEEAYTQKGDGEWPTVDEAIANADARLAAAMPDPPDGDWNDPAYVSRNRDISGAKGASAASATKLYPPRYGAKDN